MKLQSTIDLYATAGGDSWLVHPPGLVTDTPQVRDIARKRLVKTNPDIDAGGPGIKTARYKEKSQTDENAFVGKKYRTQDTKYGHLLNEYDSSDEAFTASLARPYTRVLRHQEPAQTNKSRNAARQRLVRTNPDVI
jgi:hypothetical protein